MNITEKYTSFLNTPQRDPSELPELMALPPTAYVPGHTNPQNPYHVRTSDLSQITLWTPTTRPNAPSLNEQEQELLLWAEQGIPKKDNEHPVIQDIRAEAASASLQRAWLHTDTGLTNLHTHIVGNLPPEFLKHGGAIHVVSSRLDPYANDEPENLLRLCLQSEITDTLNHLESLTAPQQNRPTIQFTDRKYAVRLSRNTTSTELSPLGQIALQPYFSTDEVSPQDHVILVDAQANSGSNLLNMAAALKHKEVHVMAAYALSMDAIGSTLTAPDTAQQHLLKLLTTWDPQGLVINELNKLGLNINTLSFGETLDIVAYLTNPHRPADIQTLHALHGQTPLTSKRETLVQTIPNTPSRIVEELKQLSQKHRRVLIHQPITTLKVLDWDCCISNEKSMHYKAMMNAIAISAQEYGSKYPLLTDIHKNIQNHLSGENYKEGMPKICLGKEKFSEYAIGNPPVWEKHMVADLINTAQNIIPKNNAMQPPQPLDQTTHKKISLLDPNKAIQSILNVEIHRHYHHTMRPTLPSKVQERIQAQRERQITMLPYPHIQPEFMKGALDYLKQHRTPSTRLVLISNRDDNGLKKEVRKMGLTKYFDHISGHMKRTQDGTIKSLFIKPEGHRLDLALEQLNMDQEKRPAYIHLIGDQYPDVLQAKELQKCPHPHTLEGVIINPKKEKTLDAGHLAGIPTQHYRDFYEVMNRNR